MKKPTKSLREIPEIPEIRRASKARVAEVLGISLTTVDRWIRDGMPVAQRNSKGIPWVLDLAEVLKWRHTPRMANVEDPEKLPPGDRKAWYEGESKRREIAERDAGLIPAAEAQVAVTDAHSAITTVVQMIPGELQDRADLTDEQTDEARQIVHEALADLTDRLQAFAPGLTAP